MKELAPVAAGPNAFPRLRWAALLWLVAWGTVYARGYPLANFLHLCDIAVILTCVGLWVGSPLLLSSQAVSSLVVDLLWDLDLVWRATTGGHIVGGTEYMWDPKYSPVLRLFSLFHVFWPPLLLWALRRVGYDGRALAFQSALAVAVLALSPALAPGGANLNFALRDPFLGRTWGPLPVHVALTAATLIGAIYWPTHALLRRVMPRPVTVESADRASRDRALDS